MKNLIKSSFKNSSNLFVMMNKFNFTSKINQSIMYKINKCKGREDKIFLFTADSYSYKNIEQSRLLYFSDVIAKFNKLKNKSVLNPIFIEEGNSKVDNIVGDIFYLENSGNRNDLIELFNLLLKKNCIYSKQIKIESNSNKHQLNWYINLKDKLFLDLAIINENLNILKSQWPKEVIDFHHHMLAKKLEIKTKFNFVNDFDKRIKLNEGKNNKVTSIEIFIERPELIFGVTYIAIKKSFLNQILIDESSILQNNASSYLLPTKIYCINPMNDEKIRIVVVNDDHSIMSNFKYNIKACIPGHDQSEFLLAKQHSLPIKYVANRVSQMSESLLYKKETKNSYTSLDMNTIRSEINRKKLDEAPIILNNSEGFLINCKDFDFLYLIEARELLVNNLVRNGKAEKLEEYQIEDWLVAIETIDNDISKLCNLNFTESFINSFLYLKCFLNKYNSIVSDSHISSNLINLNNFKKWLPVDSYFFNSSNKTHMENLFFSNLLHNFLLNELKNFLPILDNNKTEDEVYIDKEAELEKDVLFPAPYKELISLDEDSINKYNETLANLINHTYILHNDVMNSVKEFNIDKIRDEKLNINDETDELVIKIYKEIMKLCDTLSNINLIGNKLFISISILHKLHYFLNDGKFFLQKNQNFYFYIYLNYLLLLYPFSSSVSESLYNELLSNKNIKIKTSLLKSLSNYSIEKLYETCNFFVNMIINSKRVNLFINDKNLGKIILDKKLILKIEIITDLDRLNLSQNEEIRTIITEIINLINEEYLDSKLIIDMDLVKYFEYEDDNLKIII